MTDKDAHELLVLIYNCWNCENCDRYAAVHLQDCTNPLHVVNEYVYTLEANSSNG
jgi:hypothetical protein